MVTVSPVISFSCQAWTSLEKFLLLSIDVIVFMVRISFSLIYTMDVYITGCTAGNVQRRKIHPDIVCMPHDITTFTKFSGKMPKEMFRHFPALCGFKKKRSFHLLNRKFSGDSRSFTQERRLFCIKKNRTE